MDSSRQTYASERDTVAVLELVDHEVEVLTDLLASTAQLHSDVQTESFLKRMTRLAGGLPSGLREFVEGFRSCRGAVAGVVRGLPGNDSLDPTPPTWALAEGLDSARRDDIYLCLTASLLGQIFAWSTLQRGKLVTDVLPVAGEENAQSGHGTTLLAWHTEDAFHPHRCDYLLLLCLRNPTVVPTTVARLRNDDLCAEHLRTLAERRFYIYPDTEHIRPESSLPDAPDLSTNSYGTRPVSVLAEPRIESCLRIDPLFMDVDPVDGEAKEALGAAVKALENNLVEVGLQPGELLIIDNRRAVHGRGSFTARHDGGDRWLKKVMVTHSLSKRHVVDCRPHSHVID